jgi:hypothetical protein
MWVGWSTKYSVKLIRKYNLREEGVTEKDLSQPQSNFRMACYRLRQIQTIWLSSSLVHRQLELKSYMVVCNTFKK